MLALPLLSLTWTAAHAPARPTAPRAPAARAVLLPQSTPVAPAAPSLGAITSPATSTHFDRFVRLFRGHFDNLEQVEVEHFKSKTEGNADEELYVVVQEDAWQEE